MLRTAVLLLILANALFFAWTQGWLAGVTGAKPHPEREPERNAQPIERIPERPIAPRPRPPYGSYDARVAKVGRTSITVDVEVYAQRGRAGRGDTVKVTEAQLTYVAIDANRHPRPVPGGAERA